jgi:hypothetical protein
MARHFGIFALAVVLPVSAAAIDVSVDFRLVGAPGNIQGCMAADPQFTRIHTFAVKDGEGELTAPGGINTKLKLKELGVYEGSEDMGKFNLHIVADLNARTFTVTDKTLGCKWTGKKE